jgi:aspartyl-tRNA synthetase
MNSVEKRFDRTHYCGELRLANVGEKVTVIGWVSKRRNLGSLLFLDLRDREGYIQVCIKTDEIEVPDIRNEYILQVEGVVSKKDVPNKNLPTGDIEVVATKLNVINTAMQPPIPTSEVTDANEDIRLKYRYLDLRRNVMQKRFRIRADIVKATHEFLDNNGFIEIETPILAPSTPEGARDYLVPSRVHPGSFYALPQSPQLFKQMLMVSGFERYYQIARCFRDEDLRADRQPDFTQIDVETSFLNQDQIITLGEGLVANIFKKAIGYDVKLPLRRMDYLEAVNKYGSDKPDTRYAMYLIDIKDIVSKSDAEFYKANKYTKAIKVENFAQTLSRKKQDDINLIAPKFNMKQFAYLKLVNGVLEGSIVKFFNEELKKELIEKMEMKEGDALVIATGNILRDINFGLGAVRVKLAKELGLVKPDTYDLLWVVHFPLFEKSEETGDITPCHHPFTRPCDEDLDKLFTEPYNVYSYAYDIVINGYEAGGGSLRIYDQELQEKIFKVLGFSKEDIDRKFGFFAESLKYGTPPHGGFALGLDRMTMILSGTENIRDVIAFPKNLAAVDPVSNAPYEVDEEQLEKLGIEIKKGAN